MSTQPLLSEPDRIEEPQKAQEYWDLVSRVASTHHPVIVRRSGTDMVAVIAVGLSGWTSPMPMVFGSYAQP